MCFCTPEIKTPWCGKPGCQPPRQKPAKQPPSQGYWARYNDLVRLNQVLWRMRSDPSFRGDIEWEELTKGYTALVDECTRLRFWLEFVLTADAADLEQWRNGDFAASIVNGTRRI